ncbi:MAG: helix-turn-helix domain-containing protein [Flavobacterium sp.]
MQLGLKLLQLRKKLSYSQEYVAIEIGVSKTSLRKWEANESIPTIENLNKLSKFYHVKMAYWFEEKENLKENEAIVKLKELLQQGQQLVNDLEKK